MKAITIRQPWASLTVMRDAKGLPFKQVETRTWKTGYRGRIAIHAGKFRQEAFFLGAGPEVMDAFALAGICGDLDIDRLPRGSIIGEATLIDCVPIENLRGSKYDTHRERNFGYWHNGNYGWILEDPVAYQTPIPVSGKLGIWEWGGRP